MNKLIQINSSCLDSFKTKPKRSDCHYMNPTWLAKTFLIDIHLKQLIQVVAEKKTQIYTS